MTGKLVVATTFPIVPARGGGQARVLGLYSALARQGLEVEIVALVGRLERGGAREVVPGVREVRIPKTAALDGAEWALQERAGVPVTDLALALHHDLAPAFADALVDAARDAAAVVASHPFAYPALAAATDLPLLYEAHNVEADLKAEMYHRDQSLAAAAREVEAACSRSAHHVVVCAERDAGRLAELHGVDRDRIVVVPNGADPAAVPFTDPDTRRALGRRLGLERLLAVFVGSWHEPNLVVVRELLHIAPRHEEIQFVIAGSAGLAMAGKPMPNNVDLCGVVDQPFLYQLLAVANAALNPMRLGSGTNLKMLDYALAGVPLVSSAFGARGLDLEAGLHYLECDPRDAGPALAALRREPLDAADARVAAAREHVRERFSWDTIAARWLASAPLRELLGPVGTPA